MPGVLATLVLLTAIASANDVSVTSGSGRGSCDVRGTFSAPVPAAVAWQVLTDYDSLGRFVHSIESSRLERRDDGTLFVRQTAVGGPSILRRHIHVLLALELEPHKRIGFRDTLGQDFESYSGEWRVIADSTTTRIEYEVRAEPRGLFARSFCRGALDHAARELLTEVRDEMMKRALDGGDAHPRPAN
jgi:carbon monoxide dehydrogenase subunit G